MRSKNTVLALAAALLAIPLHSHAQAPPPGQVLTGHALADKVDAAVAQWMAANNIADAEVAVARGPALLGSYGHGWQPTERHPVASLSKAITGACIAHLIDKGQLALSDNLGTIFAKDFAKNPIIAPVDPRFNAITIEQLLMHKAGLVRNAFDDAHDRSIGDSFRSTLKVPLAADPGTEVTYSNSDYLVLGHVAARVTGKSYVAACADAFTQAGLPANAGIIDSTMIARGPNGGWDISAESYARFLITFNANSGLLGPASRQWLDSLPLTPGDAKNPCPTLHGKVGYGFGVCIRHTARGLQYHHNGLVHHDRYYPKTGGSLFFENEAGIAAVVIFSGENSGNAYGALEKTVTGVLTAKEAYEIETPTH